MPRLLKPIDFYLTKEKQKEKKKYSERYGQSMRQMRKHFEEYDSAYERKRYYAKKERLLEHFQTNIKIHHVADAWKRKRKSKNRCIQSQIQIGMAIQKFTICNKKNRNETTRKQLVN
jgi:hypothetical protein